MSVTASSRIGTTFGAGGVPLAAQTVNWPTPTSLSYSESHQPGNSQSMNMTLDLASSLRDRVTYLVGEIPAQERRSLNPLFVEWLMGWPIGWTDRTPLAMDKFLPWLQTHGKPLSVDSGSNIEVGRDSAV